MKIRFCFFFLLFFIWIEIIELQSCIPFGYINSFTKRILAHHVVVSKLFIKQSLSRSIELFICCFIRYQRRHRRRYQWRKSWRLVVVMLIVVVVVPLPCFTIAMLGQFDSRPSESFYWLVIVTSQTYEYHFIHLRDERKVYRIILHILINAHCSLIFFKPILFSTVFIEYNLGKLIDHSQIYESCIHMHKCEIDKKS